MQDVKLLTDDELTKQMQAFYDFVNIHGYGYLTEDGLVYFNQLRAEDVLRAQKSREALTA